MPKDTEVTSKLIESRILLFRGQRVMLSTHLAGLYGVAPKVLIQAVKRNSDRFPQDFMFQLDPEEQEILRSQTVTLRSGWGTHPKYPPFAFTEQGVAMLASVLRSPQAVAVNIEIIRAFVRLRQLLSSNAELTRKLNALERRYDAQFSAVFEAIRKLMEPPVPPKKRRIGFAPWED
jgi:hypothetical protein